MRGNRQALTSRERSIYTHFTFHMSKYPSAPCFVPVHTGPAGTLENYLNALLRLESRGLLKVDRSASKYTSWTLHKVSQSSSFFL